MGKKILILLLTTVLAVWIWFLLRPDSHTPIHSNEIETVVIGMKSMGRSNPHAFYG
jgi:hypothetical protein